MSKMGRPRKELDAEQIVRFIGKGFTVEWVANYFSVATSTLYLNYSEAIKKGGYGGLTIGFVVVPDRAQLSELVQRVRDGRLRTNIGNVAALDDAVAAFNPTERIKGKTIIRVHT